MARARLLSSLGAGFSLIARRPGAILIWAVVYLLLGSVPAILPYIFAGPELVDFYRQLFTDPTSIKPDVVPPGLEAMQRFQGLQILGSLVAISIVFTAVLRSILRPEESSWFSLRLSWAEVRTAVIVVALYIAFLIAVVAATIVVAIPIAISVAAAGGGLQGLTTVVIVAVAASLGVLLALAYPMARLSMAIPMSVAENRFRLFEAWGLTKGYGWPLVGVFLLMMLLFFVVQVILLIVLAMGAFSLVGSFEAADWRAFFERPDWARAAAGWLVAAGVISVVLQVISTPIMIAPWAEAYRRIAGVKTEDEHGVFD